MATTPHALRTPALRKRRASPKFWLWVTLFLTALSVLLFSEVGLLIDYPLYHAYRLAIVADRHLLLPHALAGTIALLSGPVQFSSRLRSRYLRAHRILGRVYVGAVFLAAPLACAISWHRPLFPATVTQSSLWVLCTLAALITARNRHIIAHRQWMVRSYALTFTFVILRVLNPWPAYWNLSDYPNVLLIILVSFASAFFPDFYFNWRELTTRRVQPGSARR